jgi:hypothetical protein
MDDRVVGVLMYSHLFFDFLVGCLSDIWVEEGMDACVDVFFC